MNRKFVIATVREVSVGDAKPRRVKIVALKYIKEFWPMLVCR